MMKTSDRGALAVAAVVAAYAMPAMAQVPVDAASDRRAGEYVFFQSFGKPDIPFEDLDDVAQVRSNSSRYFESDLATCKAQEATTGNEAACDANKVFKLADRFCQALEFDEAVTWRVSHRKNELRLHWAVCGLKK